MSDQEPQAPQPTDEHRRLESRIGTWKVECTMYTGPGMPPMTYEAEDVVEALGPFWTVGSFSCEFGGVPFQGRATMGFDPKTGKHVGTWQDTMSPWLCVFEGGLDDNGDLIMSAKSTMPWNGQDTVYHTVETQPSPDQRTFSMSYEMGDEKVLLAEYVYTRKS
ncbi:MAG: DUF1579 family protein [Acidobacteriota bacterium]